MKPKKIGKKLILNKVTISQINEKAMKNAVGGATEYPYCFWTDHPCNPSVFFCPVTAAYTGCPYC